MGNTLLKTQPSIRQCIFRDEISLRYNSLVHVEYLSSTFMKMEPNETAPEQRIYKVKIRPAPPPLKPEPKIIRPKLRYSPRRTEPEG